MRSRIFSISLALMSCTASLHAQWSSPTPEFGITPTGSYESYKVDSVNMSNGNSVVHIPLFSLPQLGKLSLSFSAVGNITFWQPEETCSPDGYDCGIQYLYSSPNYYGPTSDISNETLGMSIVPDTVPFVLGNPFNSGEACAYSDNGIQSSPCYSTFWSVDDSLGGSHSLYYDMNNETQLRSTDGSGFLYLSGYQRPSTLGVGGIGGEGGGATGNPVLIDPNGISSTYNAGYPLPCSVLISGGCLERQSDPNGNSIYVGAAFDSSGLYVGQEYVDSVNRLIPAIPEATSSITGCPAIGQNSYQPATGSAQWIVPGPNHGSTTFLICYANVSYETDFFGGTHTIWWYDGSENNSFTYFETWGTKQVIQSIVLPDSSYWGFLYDAVDPSTMDPINPTSVGLATLTTLITPDGGTINYQYGQQQIGFCNPEGYSSVLVTDRYVNDANGHTYHWNYAINAGSAVVTDSNNNDTLYEFHAPSWYGNSVCFDTMQVARKEYQGSSITGQLLKTTATTYAQTPEPIPSGDNGVQNYGNPLPQSVTTTTASGLSTTTTTGYAGSFQAIMPSWQVTYNFNSDEWVVIPPNSSAAPAPETLNLGLPNEVKIVDYTDTTLNDTKTSYLWQSNGAYYSANLLNTPQTVTVYDANSNAAAQTTTSYDESAYVANSGVLAGQQTSVTRSNNVGSSVTTHEAWTTYGMVDHTVDGNQHTDLQNTYAYQSNNSQFINLYPSSVVNALSQTMTYSEWDENTGRPLAVTDENGIISKYQYTDPLGRITTIKKAIGTPSESWTTYSYPNFTTVQVNVDQNVKGDQLLQWTTVADGLGRPIQTTFPNGATQETQYDGMDQITSIANLHLGTASDGYATFAYDALGRKAVQTQQDGVSTLQWCYEGIATNGQSNCNSKQSTLTGVWLDHADELGNDTQLLSNAQGSLLSAIEPSTAETDYTYNALGDLLKVNQLGNVANGDSPRVRTFSYDSLSRLICASNPENSFSSCPTTATATYATGTTGYTYDGNGNISTKISPRPGAPAGSSQTVTSSYTYDWLNRITAKTYTNAPPGSLSSCYQYDNAAVNAYGTGRLWFEWTQSGACPTTPFSAPPLSGYQSLRTFLTYNPLGGLLTEQQCTPGNCTTAATAPYALSYNYDLAGHLIHANDGIGQAVWSPAFDSAGRLSGVTAYTIWSSPSNPSPFYPTQLLSVQGYTPAGGLTNWMMGFNPSGPIALTGTKQYDNRLRVTMESVTGHD